MQSGAASAATAAQYTGAAVMLVMLARKDLLLPRDLPSLPPLQQWVDTLRPGIPFAFCIAAVVTALLTATNLATGLPLVPCILCIPYHDTSPCLLRLRQRPWYDTFMNAKRPAHGLSDCCCGDSAPCSHPPVHRSSLLASILRSGQGYPSS